MALSLDAEREGQELTSDLTGGGTVTVEVSKQTDDPNPEPLAVLFEVLPTATQR